jgi:hypothetical protein
MILPESQTMVEFQVVDIGGHEAFRESLPYFVCH